MNDVENVNEILSILRNHYRIHYAGYNTYIDRSNMFEHIQNLCKVSVDTNERLKSILLLAQGDL